ncbi:hypothetical protein [Nocardia pneumoniae]|nr:hypothetical protein [Nocardia pneumoniae]
MAQQPAAIEALATIRADIDSHASGGDFYCPSGFSEARVTGFESKTQLK